MKRSSRAARSDDAQEYVITSAPVSHAEDLSRRRRAYLISMSFRVLCVALLFVVPHGWAQLVVIAFAVFIPYIAVVRANAGAEMTSQAPLAESPEQAIASPGQPGDDRTTSAQEPASPNAFEDDDVIVLEPEPGADGQDASGSPGTDRR